MHNVYSITMLRLMLNSCCSRP